ncbi:MAG: hypothetical protein OER86_09175, partial [Phycisphaerae bacterium]|nr:hypothetical protein [Phycisphaerae bacterium]
MRLKFLPDTTAGPLLMVLVLSLGTAGGAQEDKAAPPAAPADRVLADQIDRVLATYVDGRGMVNYLKLKAKRKDLDAYVTTLGKLTTKTYAGWNDKQK